MSADDFAKWAEVILSVILIAGMVLFLIREMWRGMK